MAKIWRDKALAWFHEDLAHSMNSVTWRTNSTVLISEQKDLWQQGRGCNQLSSLQHLPYPSSLWLFAHNICLHASYGYWLQRMIIDFSTMRLSKLQLHDLYTQFCIKFANRARLVQYAIYQAIGNIEWAFSNISFTSSRSWIASSLTRVLGWAAPETMAGIIVTASGDLSQTEVNSIAACWTDELLDPILSMTKLAVDFLHRKIGYLSRHIQAHKGCQHIKCTWRFKSCRSMLCV